MLEIPDFGALMRLSSGELKDDPIQAFADSVPDAVVVVDDEGRITFVNRQVLTLFGYGRAELIGSPVEILLPIHLRPSHTSAAKTRGTPKSLHRAGSDDPRDEQFP